MDLSDMTVEMIRPRESFSTVRAHVGFLHASLVGSDVMAHAVLPLEALLADGAGKWLLVRVGEPVSVQVVHIPEGFPTRLTCVVFTHRVGVLGYWPLYRLPCCHDNSSRRREGGHSGSHALHRNIVSILSGQDLCVWRGQNSKSGQRLGLLLGYGEVKEREGDRLSFGTLFSHALLALGPPLHADTGVDGLMAPQVVAVFELLAAN